MTRQTPDPGPENRSFSEIKQGLDPRAGYIIFEHHLTPGGGSIFDPARPIYGVLREEGLKWHQAADRDLSMEYLVIRTEPGREDRILGRILGYGLSENYVFYIFKAKEV